MVNSTSPAQTLGTFPSIQISPQTTADSMNSFAQQLSASLEAFLSQAGNGSSLEIDISPASSQNTGASQFTVTVKNLAASAAPAGAAAAIMPGAATTPVMPRPAPASTDAASTAASGVPTGPLSLSPDDPNYVAPDSIIRTNQYWALQPPAVQQLRDIPDVDARLALGQQLAQQGYAIDPTIMVYGWSPYQVMKNRQDEGYTWVPALGQPYVPVPPGSVFPGLTSYDPSSPPAGSIRVTTDFSSPTALIS